ncbi:sporulation histidine kinase inhibitor Sda [Texcoconibacillus texcoconensis]|uniref:Sporulation inhibitor A n=1 Tax=Texcoconibacillus texcoconensis TaxID=1095777 RepID=A0A840QRK4_9BACI|nr:sporulation histidine kinase inhibitor Sda [Texcoconibacillus texcoconensis]MBB5173994.1 hypothetical protein [Texcoconibacillus texcoconensis]
MYTKLKDELLVEAYEHAVRSQLDGEFLQILKEELDRRGIIFDEAKKVATADNNKS